jgi:protein TonB
VTTPIPIYKPEPTYSPEARRAKQQGIVVLGLVIDAGGHTTDIHVIRPLDFGLDEQAVEAALKWRFRPGTKGTQPVPLRAQIEVAFRLI